MIPKVYVAGEVIATKCHDGSKWLPVDSDAYRMAFFLDAADISEVPIDSIYIVFKGTCWHVKEKSFHSSGTRAGLTCEDCSQTAIGKQLLLKEMLSG